MVHQGGTEKRSWRQDLERHMSRDSEGTRLRWRSGISQGQGGSEVGRAKRRFKGWSAEALKGAGTNSHSASTLKPAPRRHGSDPGKCAGPRGRQRRRPCSAAGLARPAGSGELCTGGWHPAGRSSWRQGAGGDGGVAAWGPAPPAPRQRSIFSRRCCNIRNAPRGRRSGRARLRGRFKEAPGWGRARAAGGPAGREPSVRLEHEGGDLRARAQPGLQRAVSGRGSRGTRGGAARPRDPQPGLALCSGAGGVAAPGPAALSRLNALWDGRECPLAPTRVPE